NKATQGGGAYVGDYGAVFAGCEFSGNSATYGGAAYVIGRGTLFTHCVMSGNSAMQHGGALFNSEAVQAVNCLFFGNIAAAGGGAWHQDGTSFGASAIIQCTMSGNSASLGGALHSAAGHFDLRNSILWGNTATSTSPPLASSIVGPPFSTISR